MDQEQLWLQVIRKECDKGKTPTSATAALLIKLIDDATEREKESRAYGIELSDQMNVLEGRVEDLVDRLEFIRTRILMVIPLLDIHFGQLIMDSKEDQDLSIETWRIARAMLSEESPEQILSYETPVSKQDDTGPEVLCRKCGYVIDDSAWRFGSHEYGWEHMIGECREETSYN